MGRTQESRATVSHGQVRRLEAVSGALLIVALIVLTSPLDSIVVIPVPLVRNPAALLALGLILYILVTRRAKLQIVGAPQRIAILVALFIVGLEALRLMLSPVLGYVGSQSPTTVLFLTLTWVQPLVLFVVIVEVLRESGRLDVLGWTFLATITVGAVAMATGLPAVTQNVDGRTMLTGVGINGTGFLMALAVTATYTWLLQAMDRSPGTLTVGLLIVAVQLAALLLTGSRGALLGMLGGISAATLLHSRPKQLLIIGTVLPLVTWLSFPLWRRIGGNALERLHAAFAGTQTGMRDRLWAASWEVFTHHPIWGVGVQASAAVGGALERARSLGTHNTVAEIGVSFGILGLLVWGLFGLSVVWGLWVNRGSPRARMFLALVAVIVVCMPFNDYARDKYVWVILAMATHIGFTRPIRDPQRDTRHDASHPQRRGSDLVRAGANRAVRP